MLPLIEDDVAPPASGLRERKKVAVRASIVDAALELFAAHGFETTPVLAVAEHAGVSAATVARYFPTKESLLFSEGELRAASLRSAILSRPVRETPWRAVVAAIGVQPPVTGTSRRRLLLSRRAIARSTALRGRAVGLLDGWRDAIAEALVARDGLGTDDARTLAAAVVAVLDDVTGRWAAAGGVTDLGVDVHDALHALDRTRKKRP